MSLTVPGGSCAAISGPSGAGKSLFLRMIADLDPNEGQVRLGELDRAAVTAPVWRRQVVYLAAEAGWWGATVDLHVPEELRPAAIDMARRLDLDADYFQRPVSSLSTGERQRLALVRALVRRPKALLLDEPSSALDTAGIARVESLLRDTLDTGAAMVLVTHDPEQGRRLGTAQYKMAAGRLTAVVPLPALHPIP